MTKNKFLHKNLLDVEELELDDIYNIFDLSEKNFEINRQKNKKQNFLQGLTLINLFFENSTRTKASFELAGKRLGADVINIAVSSSSIKKGETLLDTALTLNAMNADFLVIRHSESGTVQMIEKRVKSSVINAGDGCHSHPTQALLDAMTIYRHKKNFKDLKIVICGDIIHSRVARSNIILLNKLGCDVHLVASPTLLPNNIEQWPVTYHYNLTEALIDADVVMMLRLQTERMQGSFIPSSREYFHLYGLNKQKLNICKKDVFVMHPGPMNRGLEIDSKLADDIEKSLILEQVETGISVRQAILQLLSNNI